MEHVGIHALRAGSFHGCPGLHEHFAEVEMAAAGGLVQRRVLAANAGAALTL